MVGMIPTVTGKESVMAEKPEMAAGIKSWIVEMSASTIIGFITKTMAVIPTLADFLLKIITKEYLAKKQSVIAEMRETFSRMESGMVGTAKIVFATTLISTAK